MPVSDRNRRDGAAPAFPVLGFLAAGFSGFVLGALTLAAILIAIGGPANG